MQKKDLVDAVTVQTKLPKNTVITALDGIIEEIKNSLHKGEPIFLRGFGAFTAKKRAAKVGQNIKAGTKVNIPEHSVPHFKPAPEFRKAVKKATTATDNLDVPAGGLESPLHESDDLPF